jgi:molybdate transport system substrate-binding protein
MVVLAALLVACGGQANQAASPSASEEPALSGELLVFAAASLTDASQEVETAFETEHPDVQVTLNLGPSSGLADQIVQGAPADVFTSASGIPMEKVSGSGLTAGEPAVFARNLLQIAVEPGNPLGIRGLADLGRPDVTLVLAAPQVPAGQFAREALTKAGVHARPVSEEVDVRAVLQKVALGEADAGVVYVTDVLVADDCVDGVAIPEDQNVVASYPIAALREGPNPEAARAFVEFMLGPDGQAILKRFGFETT